MLGVRRAKGSHRRSPKLFGVDPQRLIGAQAEQIVVEAKTAPSRIAACELAPSDVKHLMQVVQSCSRGAVGPEHRDRLLTVHAMAGRERKQLHQRLCLAQAPATFRDRDGIHLHGKAAEEMDVHPGRGTGGCLAERAHRDSRRAYPSLQALR